MFNMSESRDTYKGNAIFRDQPNHSYFDKPFEDPQDCLYLVLNEINPYFMQPEQQADKRGFENNSIKDPRTQKSITQLCYDHTEPTRTRIFRCPNYSAMTRKQHVLSVQVMQALQDGDELEEQNLYSWRKLENVRFKERLEFQRFVYDFNQSNKDLIYKPAKKLLQLYKKWYVEKTKNLMIKYPPKSYNTHLGLPQVRLCKNLLNEPIVTMVNQEKVIKKGSQWMWQQEEYIHFKNLQFYVDSYVEEYINSQDFKDSLEEEIKLQFLEDSEKESIEMPLFFIPLESLLFLLTAGDYPDLPTEMLLNIKEVDEKGSDFKKTILMDTPLPSRQTGWHTYKQVVDQAVLAYLSIYNDPNWLSYNLTREQSQEESNVPEIEASCKNTGHFKALSVSEYLQNCKYTQAKNCKFSKTLIKWQLNASSSDTDFQMYTTLTQPALNKIKDSMEASESFASISLKLEYKPQFGCEIMTKYEMLEEWFKLKLLQTSKGTCLRLNVNNFQTILQETLTLQKLEQNLIKIYQIDVSQLLNNLFEFLKMLYNMPPGHYMLRYNPKFKDKLMLCQPSQEITQNTIHLHQLLKTDPTDLLFMSEQNFLPISENLCSLMHLQHQVIPCAFRWEWKDSQQKNANAKQANQKIGNSKQKPVQNFNDRNLILKKADQQKLTKEQNLNDLRKYRRKQYQRNRKTQRKAKLQEQNNEDKEIKHEMELDRKMLGT